MFDETDKKWSEMNPGEREHLDDLVRSVEKMDYKISHKYNKLLYNWLFLINAGGLVGALILLNLFKNTKSGIVLCAIMAILFAVGIIGIILAAKIEMTQFKLDGKTTSEIFHAFKQNNMTTSDFKLKLQPDSLSVSFVSKLEILSFVVFFLGIIIAFCLIATHASESCAFNRPMMTNTHAKPVVSRILQGGF